MAEEPLKLQDLEPENGNRTPPVSATYGPLNAEPMANTQPAPAQPGAGQVGSQLMTAFFLFDRAIQNPDDLGVATYEKMYRTDETFAAAVDFVIMAVLSRLGQYQHDDPQITNFVTDQLRSMQGSFLQDCGQILSALWAGFSATEMIFEPAGAQVRIDYLATYHPQTVLFRLDNAGQLMQDGILQYRWWAGTPIRISTRKVIVYTHNGQFGNPYGNSAGRRVYKNWLLKDAMLKMWATGLDRFGTPLLAATVPDMIVDDPNRPGQQIRSLDYVMSVLNNIQNQTVLGLHKGSDIKALTQGGSGIGEAFDKAVSYFNKMIMRGVLLPSLILEEGRKGGSYALGSAHYDAFLMMVTTIFKQLNEVLVDQLIRTLVELNFGRQKRYGSFVDKAEVADPQFQQSMANAFHLLMQDGFLSPEAEQDWNYVRSRTGLPLRARGEDDRLNRIAVTESDYLRGVRDGSGAGAKPAGHDDNTGGDE